MSIKKTKKKIRRATEQKLPMKEMCKIIEKARIFVDAIGQFKMEFDGEAYTIRLSRFIKDKVIYDIQAGEAVIVLPDRSQWRQLPDGYWDRYTMNIHASHME